jgi:hypothetical protein
MSSDSMPTARTRVVREPHRGVYDRDAVNQILDEGFICHIGFVVDGQPYVIPTNYGRDGNVLFIHGSAASRMLRNMEQGAPVCVTVTLLDGFVLARSVFNHSMNYRPGDVGEWSGGEDCRPARSERAHPAAAMGRFAAAERKRAESDIGASHSHHGVLGQGADGAAHR